MVVCSFQNSSKCTQEDLTGCQFFQFEICAIKVMLVAYSIPSSAIVTCGVSPFSFIFHVLILISFLKLLTPLIEIFVAWRIKNFHSLKICV